MSVTIYDIARVAGVSHTAVSAVLGGRTGTARVGAATTERILAVAAEMGYARNDLARAVVSGRTRLVAVIAREPSHEYIGHMLHGALTAAAERNYVLHLHTIADEISVDFGEALTRCNAYRPLGVYLCAIDWMVASDLPITIPEGSKAQPFVHSHCLAGMPGSAIDCDEAQGMALAVEHLRGLGHRRIAFLGGVPGLRSADERRAGFVAAMRHARVAVPAAYLTGTGWDWEHTAPCVEALLSLPSRPTAIVCANDALAVIAWQIARNRGLDVPRDLSLVGCSDELLGRFVRPQPTTIVQPFRQVGREAINRILDIAEGVVKPADAVDRRLPVQLAVRGSTAACPSAAG